MATRSHPLLRPWRTLRGALREINRNSRRMHRDFFDRIQHVTFIAGAVAAPLVVAALEDKTARTDGAALAAMVAFERAGEPGVRVARVEEDDLKRPVAGASTLAQIRLMEDRTLYGWPFPTRGVVAPTTLEITLSPGVRESRRAEVAATAEKLAAADGLVRREAERRTHVGGWIFSIGAWWVFINLGIAIALAPVRLGWRLFRRGRSVIRQGRIDRCHCPNCGYDARGSILTGRCPECGSDLYERPEY